MKARTPTSYRFTDEAKALLRTLAETLGIRTSDVLELLIRHASQWVHPPTHADVSS